MRPSPMVFLIFAVTLSIAIRAQAEVGVTANEVLIGNSLPLSGPLGAFGQAYVDAMNTVYDEVNSAGGIHGRRIKLLALDDAYVPQDTVKNAQRLIDKDKVFAFVGGSGSAGL